MEKDLRKLLKDIQEKAMVLSNERKNYVNNARLNELNLFIVSLQDILLRELTKNQK